MWVKYDSKHSNKNSQEPSVRIYKDGSMCINKFGIDMIGNPQRVDVYWNPDIRGIGIRAEQKGRYIVRYGRINSQSFAQAHDFAGNQYEDYPAKLEDGMLVIDMVKGPR